MQRNDWIIGYARNDICEKQKLFFVTLLRIPVYLYIKKGSCWSKYGLSVSGLKMGIFVQVVECRDNTEKRKDLMCLIVDSNLLDFGYFYILIFFGVIFKI